MIADVVGLLRRTKLAVVATLGAEDGTPQGAVVGIAVGEAPFEVVFDTVARSRKIANLRADARISVTAWDGEVTVQLEGRAELPGGTELARVREVYFAAHPDGRDRLGWDGITHVRIAPAWARYSDFAAPGGPRIVEWRA